MQCHHHSTCSKCLVMKVKLVLRFSVAQHPKASFVQSCLKGWIRWVIPNGRTYTQAKTAAGCFRREFFLGKQFTCILWSLGGGKCWGNIGVGEERMETVLLSFMEYLCRSVMRGISVHSVFLIAWLYLRKESSGKNKNLDDALSESLWHKNTPDYWQIFLLLLHSDNYTYHLSLHLSLTIISL